MLVTKFLKAIIKASISLFFIGLIYNMFSSSNGFQTGRAVPETEGCDCHGEPSSNTKISAIIPGGTNFKPGQKKTITVTIENPDKIGAGLNASIKSYDDEIYDAGEFTTGPGTKIRKNEITHKRTKNFQDECATFTFVWQAPKKSGEYFFMVAGIAVNKDRSSRGDEFNWMDPISIIVE